MGAKCEICADNSNNMHHFLLKVKKEVYILK